MSQSGHFVLLLDTQAPQLTWGAYSGDVAGEEFIVLYTLNEPAIQSATVELADGRILPVTVTPTALSVQLPADASGGLAIIKVVLRDEVANTAEQELTFLLVPKNPGHIVELDPGVFEFINLIGGDDGGEATRFEFVNLIGTVNTESGGSMQLTVLYGIKLEAVPGYIASFNLPGTLNISEDAGLLTGRTLPGSLTYLG